MFTHVVSLYLISTLIWGSTWIAIKMQLGQVAPAWSVTYRFALAGLLLLIYCLISQRPLKFTLKQHARIALQGWFIFCLNYWLFYLGSQYISSGLVAVVFAAIVFFNLINARIFLKTPIEKTVMLGSLIGLSGLIFTLWSRLEVASVQTIGTIPQTATTILFGFILTFSATLVASWGNIIAAANQKSGLPILQSVTIGMLYGALLMGIIAFLTAGLPTFDTSLVYLSSLGYLVVFGSIVAFGTYLKLLGEIGPSRASYIFVVIPIVALIISTFFEDFIWTPGVFIGISLILIGNYLAIIKR